MKYIGTISAEQWNLGGIKHVLGGLDVKQAIIGQETGRSGYKHYQFAINCSGDLEKYNSDNHCGWHIEHAVDWHKSIRYCRKEGSVHEFGDTVEQREYRRMAGRACTGYQRAI